MASLKVNWILSAALAVLLSAVAAGCSNDADGADATARTSRAGCLALPSVPPGRSPHATLARELAAFYRKPFVGPARTVARIRTTGVEAGGGSGSTGGRSARCSRC